MSDRWAASRPLDPREHKQALRAAPSGGAAAGPPPNDPLSRDYPWCVHDTAAGQAIIHGPALVILDEPIQGLDPVQIVEMRKLIGELRGEHTILLSTHNTSGQIVEA